MKYRTNRENEHGQFLDKKKFEQAFISSPLLSNTNLFFAVAHPILIFIGSVIVIPSRSSNVASLIKRLMRIGVVAEDGPRWRYIGVENLLIEALKGSVVG